jgi:pimeloyl-ACP methyl ester carboxylesterase
MYKFRNSIIGFVGSLSLIALCALGSPQTSLGSSRTGLVAPAAGNRSVARTLTSQDKLDQSGDSFASNIDGAHSSPSYVGGIDNQPGDPNSPARCEDIEFSVSLADGNQIHYKVMGELCYRPPLRQRIVHVLVSGATYGHLYWDFPLDPNRYSYVKALTDAGYATLNLDRIGIGQSDKPPADQVTIQSNAFVIHQIVQALRDGRGRNVRFSTVILVAHSLGSGIAMVEASTYADVDGLILTSFLHTPGPGFFGVPAALYPAQADPRFASRNLPEGYLTTLPGTRAALFYWSPSADGDVVALDEATKETITIGEGISFGELFAHPDISSAIQVPVLVVVGQFDSGFCTPPLCPEAQAEPLFYSPDAQLEVKVMPDTGHDLNLHLNAHAWFAIARNWLVRHFDR